MNTWQLLTSNWTLHPFILILSIVLTLGYLATTRFRITGRTIIFLTGIALFLISSMSVLGVLGRYYLFSAHMLQHILFLLIIPLLLLSGLPEPLVNNALRLSPVRKFITVFGNPFAAWFLGVGAMWLSHMPAIYTAALNNPLIHIIEQLSLVVCGVMFWWPVMSPAREMRINPVLTIPYLFLACVGCSILGIAISFSSVGSISSAYLNPADTMGILPLIRDGWGITPGIDQQIGGLLMWVPCCVLYTCKIMLKIATWYGEAEKVTTPSSSLDVKLNVKSVFKEQL